MHNLIVRRDDAFDRVLRFGSDHLVDSPLPRVGDLFVALGGIHASIRAHADEQDLGDREFRSGSVYRQFVAEELVAQMRPINRIARALKPSLFPGLREKFRMPAVGCYARLLARAEAFLSAIAEHKQVFIDRGMSPDFDADLAAKRAELTVAAGRKNAGQAKRIKGTADLSAQACEGIAILQELDAILSHQYRNDPGLLAAWKGARLVQRGAERAEGSSAKPGEARSQAAAGYTEIVDVGEKRRASGAPSGTPRVAPHDAAGSMHPGAVIKEPSCIVTTATPLVSSNAPPSGARQTQTDYGSVTRVTLNPCFSSRLRTPSAPTR